MNIIIEKSTASGTIAAPPSKSMAHRMLICAALGAGGTISNLSYSKDIAATANCLKSLGATIELNGNTAEVCGINPLNVKDETTFFCDESGSTLRFLLPVCLLSGKRITLKGSSRLFERPLSVYEDICKEQNIFFQKGKDYVTVCGKLAPGNYTVPGDISSQFISGLLFALPLLQKSSTVTVTGNFESASYIDLTLYALEYFGIRIERINNIFHIQGNQKYIGRDAVVEGDYSNAAFLDALNLLGSSVKVTGLNKDSLQGDRVYPDMFRKLQSTDRQFDLSDCPDLAPVMFAMAAYLGGAAFTGTARLKIKESNRAQAMADELLKFGIKTTIEENSVVIHNGTIKKPKEILCGHNDHRIVMSLSLLCSVTGGEIAGAEAVTKSYPDFFDIIRSLGIKIKEKVD